LALILLIAIVPDTAHGRTQWLLDLNLTSRYDTNIQNTEKGESDMVYVVGSQVGLNYQGADVDMAGNYNLGVELFTTHHDLNHAAQSLNLVGDLSRLLAPVLPNQSTLHFSESIVYAPNLPLFSSSGLNQSNTSAIPGAPSVDVSTSGVGTPRSDSFRHGFSLSNVTPLSALTRLNLSYSNNFTHFSDPTLVDGWTNGVRLGIERDVSRTDTLTADTSYTRFNPYGGGISNTYTLTGGDQHKFSPVFTGSAELGVGAVVYPNQIQNQKQSQAQYTMNGNLILTRKINENLQMSATLSRGFGTGSGIATVPLVTNIGSVTLDQQFTQFLRLTAALNAARNYSLGGDLATKTNVLSRGANFGLIYQIASWLESELDYSYYRQDSFESGQPDLSRNLYSFTLRARWS
jgi:hypothetical protein